MVAWTKGMHDEETRRLSLDSSTGEFLLYQTRYGKCSTGVIGDLILGRFQKLIFSSRDCS